MRRAYLEHKKVPQLRWMLSRLAEVVAKRRRDAGGSGGRGGKDGEGDPGEASGNGSLQLLDVGCGRADLTLLVAASFPELKVPPPPLNKSCNERLPL